MRQITFSPIFSAWQKEARRALAENTPPLELIWEELSADQPGLALFEEAENYGTPTMHRVPAKFVTLARRVACHRSAQRWGYLYQTLWRLTHGESKLLEILTDPDTHMLLQMDKAIRHDVHKMRAFVRFREVQHLAEPWYVAWFEPAHLIVELNSSFFVDRFANMCWSILTPDRCVHWDRTNLSFTPGVSKSEAPGEDSLEQLWQTYYSSIFNPARVKTHAMTAEMPKRYWKNLPEAQVIPALLQKAPGRTEEMIARSERESMWKLAEVPITELLEELRAAAAKCEACPLYRHATQTVFGEGPANAELVFVGEQPGDQEDRTGHPFIGPAGQLFDRALAAAGIDREKVYVTNAVKHFKWEPRGKRRLHKTPGEKEVQSCRPWLEAELRIVRPKILVCLGGTAAKAMLGAEVRVLRDRGQFLRSEFCDRTLVTVHPSSLLRMQDAAAMEEGFQEFVRDLRMVETI